VIELLRSVAGLIGWAIGFATLYALQGLSCAYGWDVPIVADISAARLVLIAFYLMCLTALGWLCWTEYPQRDRSALLPWLGFASAVIGLVSMAYTGMPVVAATICT